ncbi:IS5/IS1182 family transposase, partial [Aeromonas hydrophila]
LMTGEISLRNYNGQVGEIMVYVWLNALGLPVREPQV